jgi:ribosomal protein L22
MADERKAKRAARRPAARKAAPRRASGKRAEAKAAARKAPAKRAAGKAAPKKEAAKPAAKKAAPKKPERVAIMVRASSRYVRVAPRKARLVADQVRGLQIDKARALLQFSPRSAAQDIQKLIDSAAANAENNHDLIADEMRVAEITVDEGPTLKRFRPRALGRATPIHKRTSHISVALSPEED